MGYSEIIKLQFEKNKTPYIALYFTAFQKKLFLNYLYTEKYAWLPQLSLWIPVAHTKICFSRIVIDCAKILWY